MTSVERTSDRELVVSRAFNAPASRVFDAWTRPELMKQWWMPKSALISFVSCEIDTGRAAPTASCSATRRASDKPRLRVAPVTTAIRLSIT
jgi:hypothetical protein